MAKRKIRNTRRRTEQLYEVEIKSMEIIKNGKKGFICYFKGGDHKTIVSNCRKLYPQYMKMDDKPNINITPISNTEYRNREKSGTIKHRGLMLEGRGHIDEIMGNPEGIA